MTQTFDNARLVKPIGFQDVDAAFFNWFNTKLNLYTRDRNGDRKKIPVIFIAPERWSLAREEGIRDKNTGTLILPIIAISRTSETAGMESGFQRIFADIKKDHTYFKKVSTKSSLIKELNNRRIQAGDTPIDPSVPVYEVYTHRAPQNYALSYEVAVWSSYIEEMNEIIQKISQDYNYLSIRSFSFNTPDNYRFQAFEQEITDNSNLSDYSGDERIIRKNINFKVPAYLMPESDQRRDTFKRFWSQSKLVIKQEVAMTQEEFDKIIDK